MVVGYAFRREDLPPEYVWQITNVPPQFNQGYNSSLQPSSSFDTGGAVSHPDKKAVSGVQSTR
jgi:hypothetical protein